MRKFWFVVLVWTMLPSAPHAQDALTARQRTADLNQLAGFYAKNYAPYEWKRDVFGFDLFNLTPWLRQIHGADDLDFQEVLIDYVASLNDAHDYIAFPTLFSASLGLSVDIYDGKVLIDAINRTTLPASQYPFAIGDELVSVDGRPVDQIIRSFRKYAISANRRSTDRTAAGRIVSRNQQIMPHIPELGESAFVIIRQASGTTNTYSLAWSKIGIPLTSQGPVPSPGRWRSLRRSPDIQSEVSAFPSPDLGPAESSGLTLPASPTLYGVAEVVAADTTLPSYMRPVAPLLNVAVGQDYYSVLNFGSRFPIYSPPPGFVLRLGAAANDFFLSGTYVSNGVRIGLIRIPTMSPPNFALALQQLDQEIAYFNENTDGLVVDVMRNPGGTVSFVEAAAQRFIPAPFQTMGFEIRATAAWLFSFAAQLTSAELSNAPADVIQNLRNIYNEVLTAYNENRGRSAPVPLNATGSFTLSPAPDAYTKPLLVLTDEFSASGADMFPALIQDNQRGPIFGMRTMGAGGSVVGFNATAYTESFFRVTVSLMNRGRLVRAPGLPPAPYIENIGVQPDIVQDYMTSANLLSAGASYREAFTNAIVNLVQQAP
jgi:Peptidase family S41/PDZ domain